MYGRADPQEYLWLSGLIIEADRSKSGAGGCCVDSPGGD